MIRLALVGLLAAHMTIAPAHVLVDAPADVRVTGLPPHAAVVLRASTVDSRGRHWSSRVPVRADAHGVVDTRGSSRLFTTMTTPAGHVALWFQAGPAAVNVAAVVRGRTVARGVLMRRGRDPAVTEHDTMLAADGFLGRYLALPPGERARPAVLLLGGSGGGYADPDLAALLASHGYPTLALAYFGEPGLPSTLENIPLEYFGTALRWLGARHGVDHRRLLVIGASRGGEAAILTGTTFPTLVAGVVATSTSSYVLGGTSAGMAWTLAGKPVLGELPVERVHGPVLLFAGGEDAVIGGRQAKASFERLQQRARTYGRPDVGGVFYPRAGHGVLGIPNLPSPGEVKGLNGYVEFGGEADANAAAHADSWRRILGLLGRL